MDPYQHIEDFLAQRLSEDKMKKMQEAMENDAELRLLVKNYDGTKQVASTILEEDLSAMLHKVDKSIVQKKRNKKTLFWGIGLALLSMIIVATFYMMNKEGSDKKYFADNYVRPENKDVVRSGNLEEMDLLAQGKYFFELNKFSDSENALQLFIKEGSTSDSLSQAHYWLGHAHLNQYEWKKARNAFQASNAPKARTYIEWIDKK